MVWEAGNPQDTQISFEEFSWNDNLHIIPITLYKDIMPYFDQFIHVNMVEVWVYCGPP